MFVIDNCKNSTIYLCDQSAAITIDDCTNCKFFIGPCESSVFVRNTKNCQFVIACQQFRLRDGENLSVMIFSQTPPIIESSVNIKFGCFKFGYFELQQQFKTVGLNVWNNRWSEIHDYTKKSPPNFSFLEEGLNPYELIPKISSLEGGDFSDKGAEDQIDIIVPITLGNRQRLYEEELLLFVMPGYENNTEQMIPTIHKKKPTDIFFIRARATPLPEPEVSGLFSKEEWKNLKEGTKINWNKDEFVFIHFGGKDLQKQVKAICEELLHEHKTFHIWTDAKKINDHCKLVFEAWREEK